MADGLEGVAGHVFVRQHGVERAWLIRAVGVLAALDYLAVFVACAALGRHDIVVVTDFVEVGTFGRRAAGEGARGISYVTATDPAGPWSDPVWLDEWWVDPSLDFYDGKAYYLSPDNAGSFLLGTLDMETGKVIEPRRKVATGLGGSSPEGPHFYKIGDYYYIMSAVLRRSSFR